MTVPYDAAEAARFGYGSSTAYGAHQAAQARQYASGALPLPPNVYDSLLNASSTFDRQRHRHDHRRDRQSTDRQSSVPPPTSRHSHRERDRSSSPSSRDESPGAEDPVRRAQRLLKGTFSNSTSGLGVGILGAIVGGLVAREASESATQDQGPRRRRQSSPDQDRKKLISTVLGAAVGGLGANAIGKRLEKTRDRIRDHQDAWEEKPQRSSRRRSLGEEWEERRSRR